VFTTKDTKHALSNAEGCTKAGRRGGFKTRPSGEEVMAKPKVGDHFPTVTLQDLDGETVEFPAVFSQAPATVVFFYRGRW